MTQSTTAVVHRRFLLAALWLPLLYTVVALIWQWALLPSLPDPIAIHWGANGQPNGFAPAWTNLVLTTVFGIGIPLLFAGMVARPIRRGEQGMTFRFLGAVASWLSVLVSGLAVGTMISQSGLDDARNAPSVFVPLIAAVLLATAAGLLAWFIQPAVSMPKVSGREVQPVSLAAGEQAAWMRETSMPTVFVVVLSLLTLALFVASVWALATTDLNTGLVTLLAPVVLTVALLSTTVFRVRVNGDGLTVRSLIGWPRFHVPLDQVASVEARTVYPMGDFGGWGVRWRPNAWGVVLREGEGMVVTRTNGKQLIVSVNDAETGAALLAALVARQA